MNRSTASTLALLLIAGCAGSSEATTTTGEGSTSTTVPASTTSTLLGTTTSEATTTTDPGPPPTLPPVIAAAVFDFTGGAGSILVSVAVSGSPDGPWLPAGFDAETIPQLEGPRYWVQFTIENQDQLDGTVVDVEISGFDNSDLDTDVCTIGPIAPGQSGSCVAGGDEGFAVESGGHQNDYTVSAVAERQGYPPDRWFQPPVPTSLDYAGARHSFVFLFEIDSAQGTRIKGTADGDTIEVDEPGFQLSRAVAVDCSDSFRDGFSDGGGSPMPGEPPVVAFVIENFSDSGEGADRCDRIPTGTIEMDVEGDDSAYLYEGVDVGST